MKTLTLTAVLTLALHSLACGGVRQQQGATTAPSPTPETLIFDNSDLSPEGRATLKNLLFADETIEKYLGHLSADNPGKDEEPNRSFNLYVAHSNEGKVEEAKQDLRRVLALPVAKETRVSLLTWTSLRALGERPTREEADEVQGVTCEVHYDTSGGTLAAYADGTARWIGDRGAIIIWEPSDDKVVNSLIAELLKAARPLVKRVPAVERHEPSEVKLEHFRVSVLTLGGIHTVDVYNSDMKGEAHHVAPVFMAYVLLLKALDDRSLKGQ